jgi:hypothetical protein
MQVTKPAGEGSLWQVSPKDVCTRDAQARTGRTDVSHHTYAPTAAPREPVHTDVRRADCGHRDASRRQGTSGECEGCNPSRSVPVGHAP